MGDMRSKEIYTKLDRWFTDTALVKDMLEEPQVHSAVQEQVNLRQAHGRCPRIWEILVMQKVLTNESVDEVLDLLGKEDSDDGHSGNINMLGRVLVDVGYTTYDQILRALDIQASERADGKWRLLGQILIEEKIIVKSQLQEALNLLEERRKSHK